MPNKRGIVFVMLGAVLVTAALLLLLYNGYEDRNARQHAETLMDDLQTAAKETMSPALNSGETAEQTGQTEAETAEPLGREMSVVTIDGYEYIGYLSIPSLGLDLPVMAEWDYKRLKIAPCRHFGSSRTDNLVIAAHNYKSHFGTLSRLDVGAEVIFTDMDGIVNRYHLIRGPQTLPSHAVDEVQNSGCDLVLYTCTPGGKTRVAVFCDRIGE